MAALKPDYIKIIGSYCDTMHVPPNLVKAICRVESNWNEHTLRFEPMFTDLSMVMNYAHKLAISAETEAVCQKTSWGLMQIMGAVARNLGFDDILTKLLVPENNLYFGVKLISELMKRFPIQDDVISAYNRGYPKKANGLYLNQKYVDDVNKWVKYYDAGN